LSYIVEGGLMKLWFLKWFIEIVQKDMFGRNLPKPYFFSIKTKRQISFNSPIASLHIINGITRKFWAEFYIFRKHMYPCTIVSREINHSVNCMCDWRFFGAKGKNLRMNLFTNNDS
jgi:hypothetical protein